MQTARKKKRSFIDYLIIMNAIIEKKTRPQKYFYIVCSAEKCFDKFRLKESLIEMAKLILKLILKRFMKSIKLEEF